MKVYSFLIVTAFLLMLSSAVIIGCKYDVAEPLWDKPTPTGTTVTITSIEPADALPGVNTITIHGSGFTDAIDTSISYQGVNFNSIAADIIDFSSTSIRVRRPNLVSDSVTVSVFPTTALVEAKSAQFRVTSVHNQYGSFLDNVLINALAVDSAENLYALYGNAPVCDIYKVTPSGVKTRFTTQTTRQPTDARIGLDGKLYLVSNNRAIEQINLETGEKKAWYNLSLNRQLRSGDFDASGYFFAAGYRTDLYAFAPDSGGASALRGGYSTDSIYSVRVHDNFLYVAARLASNGHAGIWRHSISSGGVLSVRELVVDLSQTEFASRLMRGMNFNFSPDGAFLYITTNTSDPILFMNMATSQLDILYKGILPSGGTYFCFGTSAYGNKIYMITSIPSWTVYRVDVGSTGSPTH